MKFILMALLAVLSAFSACANDLVEGTVVSVLDGNTIEVAGKDQQKYKLVLTGIDCPELGQAYGEEAKSFLEKMILHKNVTIAVEGKDRWGNRLAVVKIKGVKDPRIDLLKEGLAWTAEKNSDPELDGYKLKAQEKGKGLWQSENPTPPWTYRRQQTMLEAKGL
ncbi:thermonuclease family protein [Pseudochryseolinea flava]|uniref:TNase-like domain-containing protein n=1 Tax=Pseudochryseolinea flava TaxID=2059302 RepID=A0A364Y6W6_9BACT|nr:thermonuclease family protein [Pseudochryseolinea flava]RAW02680.1 hypothetical protein DQQ10_00805 [Pseudochryseolinea flava]